MKTPISAEHGANLALSSGVRQKNIRTFPEIDSRFSTSVYCSSSIFSCGLKALCG